MEPNPAGPNMIDTTDNLEAVNVFKSMKNFLFWLIILSLLILLGMFLMVRFGGVRVPNGPAVSCSASSLPGCLLMLAAQPEEELAEDEEPLDMEEDTYDPIEQQAREITGQEPAATEEPEPAEVQEPLRAEPEPEGPGEPSFDWGRIRPTARQAVVIIRIFNYICLISAILYSLTLLFCLKVSLTGRLGGIRHIARAFFISLFAFVFLFPWQAILPRVMIGAIYLPGELVGDSGWLADGADADGILVLLRFVGLWLVVFFLYLWAQMRSMKWARAILKRLGVVR